jgi:hypothetical protein
VTHTGIHAHDVHVLQVIGQVDTVEEGEESTEVESDEAGPSSSNLSRTMVMLQPQVLILQLAYTRR